MGKRKELKTVIKFLSNYLVKKNKKKKKFDDIKTIDNNISKPLILEIDKEKNPLEKLLDDATHIKTLMDKIDIKTKVDANTNSLLDKQRKEFNEELKKVKEDAIERLQKQKEEEDEIYLSGETRSLNREFVRKN